MENTVPDRRRLSRKDGMIKTLYPVVHNDILDWGLAVDDSNARRFDILGNLSSIIGLENGLYNP